jgi:hypothetical protein
MHFHLSIAAFDARPCGLSWSSKSRAKTKKRSAVVALAIPCAMPKAIDHRTGRSSVQQIGKGWISGNFVRWKHHKRGRHGAWDA